MSPESRYLGDVALDVVLVTLLVAVINTWQKQLKEEKVDFILQLKGIVLLGGEAWEQPQAAAVRQQRRDDHHPGTQPACSFTFRLCNDTTHI